MALNSYRLIAISRQLNLGVADTFEVTIGAVAKCNSLAVPYCLPNEWICAELARAIRLPVPPCGIVDAPRAPVTQWFASLDFNLTGNTLPPVDPIRCAKELPDLSAGLCLFDAWVANCDRHEKNLAVDFSSVPPRMSVFDHSHALFGHLQNDALNRFAELRNRLAMSGGSRTAGNRHCLLDALLTDIHFSKWLERIRMIPDYFIDELCDNAAQLGATAIETQAATEFLKHRRDHLVDIIDKHRSEFGSILTWSLWP